MKLFIFFILFLIVYFVDRNYHYSRLKNMHIVPRICPGLSLHVPLIFTLFVKISRAYISSAFLLGLLEEKNEST